MIRNKLLVFLRKIQAPFERELSLITAQKLCEFVFKKRHLMAHTDDHKKVVDKLEEISWLLFIRKISRHDVSQWLSELRHEVMIQDAELHNRGVFLDPPIGGGPCPDVTERIAMLATARRKINFFTQVNKLMLENIQKG